MESFFEWLQGLSIANWIATDETIWSFPLILFLHSVGMGLTAGVMFMICLRLVGVGRPLPVSSMRMLFKIFWAGFVLNAITGSLLFAAHATITGNQPIYYAKLTLIAVGVVLAVPLEKFVQSEGSDGSIPSLIRGLAAMALAVWVGVITTGRFIAYLQ
ncbi:MAG TPA: hypothetical protein VL693_18985 [Vicinamibacterales bacterium]|jgi:hypothetical protein|nr:hypothetical protein [Vicinamibacterales bacterium]